MGDQNVTVHVGLTRERQDALMKGGQQQAVAFAADLGIEGCRTGKLDMFGIISGEVNPAHVEILRQADGVAFVDIDGKQRAI